jgi:hypothetical protein
MTPNLHKESSEKLLHALRMAEIFKFFQNSHKERSTEEKGWQKVAVIGISSNKGGILSFFC